MSSHHDHTVYPPDDDGYPKGTPSDSNPEPAPQQSSPAHEESDSFDPYQLSSLQLFDLVRHSLRGQGADHPGLDMLRERIAELEDIQDQARETIEALGEAVDKLKAPALRLGTLLQLLEPDRALVCVNGSDYVCSLGPDLSQQIIETGSRVLLNEAYAVIDTFGLDNSGPLVQVAQVLPEGRVRVASEAHTHDFLVERSSLLAKEKLKPGLDVRLDPHQRIIVEIIGPSRRVERSLSEVTEIDWDQIGGQHEAIEAIRDTIEMPFLHSHLFEAFQHNVPKGFLLYGPPGCGKTLMAKATAHNLRRQIQNKTGEDHPEFFLHVKGPEILNMWLGESERQVRDLFAQCREKAAEGHLAFLFIDEAESILGTRGGFRGGHGSIISTLVPMFCAEMDGVEALNNVVIILASNRADLIDPAILRPGRIDRKIRVKRPDRDAAREIYNIYIRPGLPLEEPREAMVQAVVDAHFEENPQNRFLEVTFRSGKKNYLYRGDLCSGAIIAGIVERAKGFAIKRSIESGRTEAISIQDLVAALDKEYAENELFPPGDMTEDWLKLTDFNPDNVVRLAPSTGASDSQATQTGSSNAI